jgi:hypothetical protein
MQPHLDVLVYSLFLKGDINTNAGWLRLPYAVAGYSTGISINKNVKHYTGRKN